MAATILFVVLIFAFVVPVGLYVLVRAEHVDRDRMDGRAAERVARRDEE